jgi:hypothetical protein
MPHVAHSATALAAVRRLAILVWIGLGPWATAPALPGETITESARAIPVAAQVDVLVVGGSTGGVAAAVAAADRGAKVFLVAEQAYLGDDMTATLRLWPQPDDEFDAPLARQLFADPQTRPASAEQPENGATPRPDLPPPRPLHVKRTLDQALLAAHVQYLYSCFPCDVLRDSAGTPCGIVIANRAGRQAVIAKVVIDATARAVVARRAGGPFHPAPAGPQTIKYVVIGGRIHTGKDFAGRIAAPPYHGPFPNPAKTSSGEFLVIEYTFQVPQAIDTDAQWAAMEQAMRSKTYDPEQQFTADTLYCVPPAIHARQSETGPWRGASHVPIDALRPARSDALYVLGPCADVSRAAAEHLLRPGTLITLGTRLGRIAADDAARRPPPDGIRVSGETARLPAGQGEVRELLAGPRPGRPYPTVPQPSRSLPVLGRYDVVVIGGGTCGAPAAIAAARQGAKTLVVEQYHGLGGLGTLGTVAGYFFGNRCGFTASVPCGEKWVIEHKMQWWREELLKAGGDVWFGCLGCGALVHDGRVCGAVVATPRGRGIVLASVVVDTTGSADIAVAAGATCLYTDHRDFSVLGAGVPPRNLGAAEGNVDFCIVDETDLVDLWHLHVYAKQKHPQAFDQAPIVDSRERRRAVGDHVLTILDLLGRRRYPDTIAVAYSIYDPGPTGGYTLHPVFLTGGWPAADQVDIPYRCCLPQGLDGILVAALGLSVDHDALPMIRMQADLQNLGYAVGVAAAMSARTGQSPRRIDVRALQRHLVDAGNVPARVLSDHDTAPLSDATLAESVRRVAAEPKQGTALLAQFLSKPESALPLLRTAYAESEGRTRLTYASMLGVLGDPSGVDTLLGALAGYSRWDRGWNFRPPYDRPSLSPLDRLILVLGRAGDRRAVPRILSKLELLTADDDFSHHRSVALALEWLADPVAARPLAQLLAKPGMSGHAYASIEVALDRERPGGGRHVAQVRRETLRELMLARALYRCGDYQGVGEKTLRNYAEDLRGHLARHARAVLSTSDRPAKDRHPPRGE